MFTLAHELAHVFVGATGVSKIDTTPSSGHDAERFCNSAAAGVSGLREGADRTLETRRNSRGLATGRCEAVQGQCAGRRPQGAAPALDRRERVSAVPRRLPAAGGLADRTRLPAATSGTVRTSASAVDSGRRSVAPSRKVACRIAKRMPLRACAVTGSTPSCVHWSQRRDAQCSDERPHSLSGSAAQDRSLVHVLGARRLPANPHTVLVSGRRLHRPLLQDRR